MDNKYTIVFMFILIGGILLSGTYWFLFPRNVIELMARSRGLADWERKKTGEVIYRIVGAILLGLAVFSLFFMFSEVMFSRK